MKNLPTMLYVLQTTCAPFISKIGVSRWPWDRARTCSKLLKRQMIIRFIWLPKNRSEAYAVESYIKRHLWKYRVPRLGHEMFAMRSTRLMSRIHEAAIKQSIRLTLRSW